MLAPFFSLILKNRLSKNIHQTLAFNQNRRSSLLKSPELPVVFEENNHLQQQINLVKNQNLIYNNKMQTLAEHQYNQLNYHLAALSCVCDNNQNLTNNYSSLNLSSTSNQNSPSSVDSDEYSSPYNSPPSSPSSVSSYSSAEEDCSILTPSYASGLKFTNSSNNTNSLNKNLNNSNQSLAVLITVDHSKLINEQQNSIDVDCATAFQTTNLSAEATSTNSNQGLLTTVTKLNSDLNNNSNNRKEMKFKDDNDVNQQQQQTTTNSNGDSTITAQQQQLLNRPQQVRVRKTSILRNQTPPGLANYCKKEVKFADTLGFALEKVKYFPPNPQAKPKRHSVNLATLHRDYYDEHQELFILHSRPQTEDNQTLAKRFEERSELFTKQQSRLNTNIFNNQKQQQQQQQNSFWSNYSTDYHRSFNAMRDEYCGDMFPQTSDNNNLTVNSQLNQSNAQSNQNQATRKSSTTSVASATSLNNNNVNKTNLLNSYSQINYKTSNSLEFNSLNFMNNQTNNFVTLPNNLDKTVSFLPLNFGQPYIQSDFPNRLRSQSVLLHSFEVIGYTVHGLISVMNLTFEKKITVKFTVNKWVTEKYCDARYIEKDCDNSDKFRFQISLKETDFPQFQLNEDRTMMFAVRYETGDRRIYWDNNFGQDYRLKCKFN